MTKGNTNTLSTTLTNLHVHSCPPFSFQHFSPLSPTKTTCPVHRSQVLSITEAFAGSDVAGLRTTAVLDASGENYIVNGTKKWITGGMYLGKG